MTDRVEIGGGVVRRQVLRGAAGFGATAVLAGGLCAQGPARWRRWNVASPQGQAMLASYRIAIAKLLSLPPTDPRNWYRIAFTHYLDCPHGNWWLYPWHRGFTGWVEQIVRQFSGNPDFAFPFWDWTANPEVPAAMQGVLKPDGPGFIHDIQTFTAQFQPALAASGYFTPGSLQLQQLTARGVGSNNVLWNQLTDPKNNQYPSFFPVPGMPDVRNPSPLLDCVTSSAVSLATITAGLSRTAYVASPLTPIKAPPTAYFSSPKAAQHSEMVGFAILEGQPHNMVHNNTGGVVYPTVGGQCGTAPTDNGGFMQAFLSPVDPLFFLHHSNLDRLWTVWTQKQTAKGMPTLPQGPDLAAWSREPFLFYCNAAGQPLPNAKAGDYATIGAFSYDYGPGSGTPTLSATMRSRSALRFVGEASVRATATGGAVFADSIRVVPKLVGLAAAEQDLAGAVVTLTLSLPPRARGQVFPVYVDAGDAATRVEVGRISLFGHAMAHGPMSFSLPVGGALAALRRNGTLKTGATLRFTAAAPGAGAAMMGMTVATGIADETLSVQTVVIES